MAKSWEHRLFYAALSKELQEIYDCILSATNGRRTSFGPSFLAAKEQVETHLQYMIKLAEQERDS